LDDHAESGVCEYMPAMHFFKKHRDPGKMAWRRTSPAGQPPGEG
jgi:hypothetical protein